MTHTRPPLALVRSQVALARALLDELEDMAPGFDPARAPSAQAIEELTRLGCRIFETAAVLALEEEARRGPRVVVKCLDAEGEADPTGVDSPRHPHAAAESR
jgi:hypothetical protein